MNYVSTFIIGLIRVIFGQNQICPSKMKIYKYITLYCSFKQIFKCIELVFYHALVSTHLFPVHNNSISESR